MAVKQVLCRQNENVYQAFAHALKTGLFPANAQLFPLKEGVLQPKAPAGFLTVGTILIRPKESFAVGVPAETPPSFEVGV
jgi:hypothetical protein